MDSIAVLRQQLNRIAAEQFGKQPGRGRSTQAQMRTIFLDSDILNLPVDVSGYLPMQDLNTASATFGSRFFIPDYDNPDDDRYPIR